MYDLIIIGGGPAGVAASVYASRKQLNTLLITKEWGGQSNDSLDIQNWIGTVSLSGLQLAKNLETHARAYAGEQLTLKEKTGVIGITKNTDQVEITMDNDQKASARALLITSGSKRRALEVPGAAEFENKGLTYCASCDGPIFAGADVAVVGGGNAGFETAAQLLAYAKSVTLLNRSGEFKADPVTVEKVLAHPNMKSVKNADIVSIEGDKFVSGLTYQDNQSGETATLPVTGVFVEIGMIPNTDFVTNTVATDEYHRIKIDPWTQKTGTPGIWAAGDCTNIRYHQNNISAGDAVKALEDIYVTLKTK